MSDVSPTSLPKYKLNTNGHANMDREKSTRRQTYTKSHRQQGMLGQERCSSPGKTTEFDCLGPNISHENTYTHIHIYKLHIGCVDYILVCIHEFEGEQRDVYEIGEKRGKLYNYIS